MTAQSIPADQFLEAIRGAGIQDIVLVPDTHQRTLLDLLMADPFARSTVRPKTRPSRSRPG